MTKKIAQPIQIGKLTLRNRMVMPPMETRLSTIDGDVTREMIDYYTERAKGGVGAIIVENTFVDNIASRSSLASSGLASEHLVSGKHKLAEAIKENGAKAFIQLSHGGRQAGAYAVPGQECLAPSAIPSRTVQRVPRALTIEEIVGIEDAFAEAARRAQAAGFDGVEIHGAHGYLICQFLSPDTNRRSDEYGGSLENRVRFAKNIVEKVRAKVGYNFVVGFRISGDELVPGGLTIEETTKIGQMLEDEIDYIHVSVGQYESMADNIPPLYKPQGEFIHLATAMKAAVTKAKVITVNSISAQMAIDAIEEDKADLVAFGRGLIADPELPKKIVEDRLEDIRPCMRGLEGCVSLFFKGCGMRCEVNPMVGREREYKIRRAEDKKNVVVVGGGMAGMEAARVADLYGHNVTLLEKTDELGGHFIEATMPSFKSEALGVLNWLRKQIEKSNVNVVMNTEATEEVIKSYNADSVILAVGSEYLRPGIEGIENTMSADVVLRDINKAGDNVTVIGGGLVGAETALFLAQAGKKVTVIEMLDEIVALDDPISKQVITEDLVKYNANVITSARVIKIGEKELTYVKNGQEETVSYDNVIGALGLGARRNVVEALNNVVAETYVIGDAVRGRKIYECTHEAWAAVRNISNA